MVKTGVFKKIAALTAAVAMVGAFAASASAVNVTTTTQYVEGNEAKVNVIANVDGLGGAVEVTYYATNGSDVVYVDQATAETDGTATFDYVTAATNLDSGVKVGYTNATAAEDASIPGYEISGEDITAVKVPTEEINGTHTLAYTLPDGKVFEGVTATGATVVSSDYANGALTVVLADAAGDVTLTVNTKNAIVRNPSLEGLGAAGIISTGVIDEGAEEVAAAEGNRVLTVLAKAVDTDEYGIIVTKDTRDAEYAVADMPSNGKWAAKGKNDAGYFAIQLIDEQDLEADATNALLQPGLEYNVYLYYLDCNTNTYKVNLYETITIAE